MKLIDISFA